MEIRFGRENNVDKNGKPKRGLWRETLVRHGTIINDLLDPKTRVIHVHWDGNAGWNQKDVYMPDELILVEDEIENVA